MSLNKNIKIGLQLDAGAFIADATRSARALDQVAEAAGRARSATGAVNLGDSGAGATSAAAATAPPAADYGATLENIGAIAGAVTTMSNEIRQALFQGFAPLTQLGSQIAGLVNQVAGTLDLLARKIEGAMRFQSLQQGLSNLQAKIRGALAGAAEKSVESLRLIDRAVLALFPGADKAISVYRTLARAMNFVGSAGRSAQKPLEKLRTITFAPGASSAQRLGQSVAGVGTAAAVASPAVRSLGLQIAAALGIVGVVYKATSALVGFFTGGVKGAISLVETENKVTQAFGASGAKVTAFAGQMAHAFGLPKGEALDAASSFGLMATGAGQSKEAAAQMSIALTQLAADTASLYHIPLPDALGKIQSALAGESKPLRELGVNISDDAVKAEGMRLGFIKTGQDLNDAGKIAARTSLIMKGLGVASGDLARTQDSTANRLLIFHGNLTNLATTIGTAFLPALNKGISVLNEIAVAGVNAFSGAEGWVAPAVGAITAGLDSIGLVFRNLPLFGEIAWIKIRQGVYNTVAVIETLPENLRRIADYLANNWREIIVDAVNAVWRVFQNLGTNIGELWFAITHVFETGEWSPNFVPLLEGFQATAAKLPELAKPQFVDMGRELEAVFDQIGKNEAARANVTAKIVGPKVEAPKLVGGAAEDKTQKGKEAKEAGALELGSKEAVSAIAKFRNEGGADRVPRAPLAEAQTQTKTLRNVQTALQQIAARGGSSNLAAYTL